MGYDLKKYRNHLEVLLKELTDKQKMFNEQFQQEITRRKRAEDALRASMAKYKELTDLLPVTVFIECEGM